MFVSPSGFKGLGSCDLFQGITQRTENNGAACVAFPRSWMAGVHLSQQAQAPAAVNRAPDNICTWF